MKVLINSNPPPGDFFEMRAQILQFAAQFYIMLICGDEALPAAAADCKKPLLRDREEIERIEAFSNL